MEGGGEGVRGTPGADLSPDTNFTLLWFACVTICHRYLESWFTFMFCNFNLIRNVVYYFVSLYDIFFSVFNLSLYHKWINVSNASHVIQPSVRCGKWRE